MQKLSYKSSFIDEGRDIMGIQEKEFNPLEQDKKKENIPPEQGKEFKSLSDEMITIPLGMLNKIKEQQLYLPHCEKFIKTQNIKEFIKGTIEDFENVTLTIEDIEIRFKKQAGPKLITKS